MASLKLRFSHALASALADDLIHNVFDMQWILFLH